MTKPIEITTKAEVKKSTEPTAEEKITAELEQAAYYLNMSKGTSQFDECKAEFEKVRREFFQNKNLDILDKDSWYRNILVVAREKAEKNIAMFPSCTQRLVNMFESEQQAVTVYQNPHDSVVMESAVEEIVKGIKENIAVAIAEDIKQTEEYENIGKDKTIEYICETDKLGRNNYFYMVNGKKTRLSWQKEKELLNQGYSMCLVQKLTNYDELARLEKLRNEYNETRKEEPTEEFILTIEEPKPKKKAKSTTRRNRSKKAIERAMDEVCENLFPEVTAIDEPPKKIKTTTKKRYSNSKKAIELAMDKACADLFEEYHKGFNLFAA